MPVVPQSPEVELAVWREFAAARTPAEFYRGWLAIQCRMIPDVQSGVVIAGAAGGGRFAPVAVWPERERVQHLGEVAERALAERHGIVLRRDRNGDEQGGRCDVAFPIEVEGKVHGVVALALGSRPEADVQEALRQLQWGAGWLEVLVHRMAGLRLDPATAEAGRERLQAVLELVGSALGHDRFYAAASAFATALATRLGCDRVSVGFVARGRARVGAVSHSAQFSAQANLVRAIGAAMDEAIDQGATIVHPARPASEARVTRAHAELARQHGAGAICTVPFAETRTHVGAITFERPGEHPFDPVTVELCEAVAAVAGPLLERTRRDDRWLVMKAVETGRRQLGSLIGPRHLGAKLVAVVLVGVIAFLALAKADYRVSAKSVMEAGVRRAAVAPFNGYIKEAPVRAGDLVREGAVLVALDDRDLRLEHLKWLSQHDQLTRQHQQAVARRDAAQINIIAAQIAQAAAQLALLEDHLKRTRVKAAFAGVVVTGDLSQSLGAPVERGQVLFEIAPLEEYRVVLQVDERDIADVTEGQRGQLLLAASPTDTVPFVVTKITPVSTAREGRNYFRVEGKLERTPERLRPGMEGVGKVQVDQRLLVWIWTRQIIDWARLKLWAWLP